MCGAGAVAHAAGGGAAITFSSRGLCHGSCPAGLLAAATAAFVSD